MKEFGAKKQNGGKLAWAIFCVAAGLVGSGLTGLKLARELSAATLPVAGAAGVSAASPKA